MGLTQHQKIVLGFGLVLGLGVFSVWAFKKYSKASSNGEAKVKIERIPKRKRKRTPTQSDSIEVISEEITTVSSPSVVKSKKSIQEGERSIESIPVENVVSTDNDHKLSVEKTMSLCDAPIAELMSLSAESKQRVFYALLMQGEALMTKGRLSSLCLIPFTTLVLITNSKI